MEKLWDVGLLWAVILKTEVSLEVECQVGCHFR